MQPPQATPDRLRRVNASCTAALHELTCMGRARRSADRRHQQAATKALRGLLDELEAWRQEDRQKAARWRWLAVNCPTCGVGAGEMCLTSRGEALGKPHPARVVAGGDERAATETQPTA